MSDIRLIVSATDKATPTLKRINSQVDKFDRAGGRGRKTALGFGTALKAAGAAAAAIGFAKLVTGIVSTNAMFESLRASLKTVTGSLDGARVAMHQIEEFTKSTPFQLEEVANSFIILKRMGIDTTTESLKAFGNIAAANGKSFEQLSEAVADAMTGEFERLKEFGIKVKKENGQFIASMGSTQLSVSNSAEEMVKSLKALGEDGGQYASGLADQAATMGGKFSNLKDNLASFAKGIGEGGLNTALKEVLDSFNSMFTETGNLATVLGAGLGAAIITVMDQFKGFVTLIQGVGDVIYNFGRNAKNDVVDAFQNMKNRAGDVLAGLLGKFGTSFEEIAGIAKRIINFVINVFRSFYKQAWMIITKLPTIWQEVFIGIGRLAIDFGNRMVLQFKSIGKAMKMAIQAPFTDITFADALKEAGKNAFDGFTLADSFDLPDVLLTKEEIKEIFGQDGFTEVKKFIQGASDDVIKKLKVMGINISNLKTPGEALNDFMATYNRLLQEGADEQEALNQALKTQATLLEENGEALTTVTPKLTAFQQTALDAADAIKKGFEGMAGSITNTFFDMFTGVSSVMDGLKSIAGMVFEMVAKAIIQTMIVQPLINSLTGGMGGFFSGFFAQGGMAPGGQAAIVGENGPELIVPSSNTRVFSNSQTNGLLNTGNGGEEVTVNFNINAVSTKDGVEFLIENKNIITSVIQDAYQTRGRAGPLG